jgi:general secretion pathway protein G
MKKAFTMVELVFVIVILGILATVALPKFNQSKSLAELSNARADVSTIRSAILTERQSQIVKGISSYIPKLSDNSDILFTGDGTRTLLTYGIASGSVSGKWSADDEEYKKYTFHIDAESISFTYDSDSGKFTCDRDDGTTGKTCKKIVD